jgi:hypothetical protein
MKKSYLLLLAVLLTFVWAAPLSAQETKPEPKTPAAKVAPKAAPAPAPAPKAAPKTEPATKVVNTGSVTVTGEPPADDKKEEAKADEKPAGDEKPAETKAEESQEWWETGLAHLLKLVFLILGLMATALVRVLMKKYGFEEQSGKINDLLTKALGFAEQKALKASKLEEGKLTSGAEKMEMAIKFAQGLAKDYKLPEKGSDWWEDKLESWLGVQKNGSATKPKEESAEG